MGIFDDIGDAISDAASGIAKGVDDLTRDPIGAVAGAAEDAVKAAGAAVGAAGDVVAFARDQLETGVERVAEPILGTETARDLGHLVGDGAMIAASVATGGAPAAVTAVGAVGGSHLAGDVVTDVATALGADHETASTIGSAVGTAAAIGLGGDPITAASNSGLASDVVKDVTTTLGVDGDTAGMLGDAVGTATAIGAGGDPITSITNSIDVEGTLDPVAGMTLGQSPQSDTGFDTGAMTSAELTGDGAVYAESAEFGEPYAVGDDPYAGASEVLGETGNALEAPITDTLGYGPSTPESSQIEIGDGQLSIQGDEYVEGDGGALAMPLVSWPGGADSDGFAPPEVEADVVGAFDGYEPNSWVIGEDGQLVETRDLAPIAPDPADEAWDDQYLEPPDTSEIAVGEPIDYSEPILDEAPGGSSAENEPNTESPDASDNDLEYARQNAESAEPGDEYEEPDAGSGSEASDEYEESDTGSESEASDEYEAVG